MNCDVRGHVLRSSYNLPVHYSYCNSFFIIIIIIILMIIIIIIQNLYSAIRRLQRR